MVTASELMQLSKSNNNLPHIVKTQAAYLSGTASPSSCTIGIYQLSKDYGLIEKEVMHRPRRNTDKSTALPHLGMQEVRLS